MRDLSRAIDELANLTDDERYEVTRQLRLFRMMNHQHGVRGDELDWHGKQFGFVRTKRKGCGDLITVYSVDDDWWHAFNQFDIHWAPDLLHLVRILVGETL